MVNELEIYIEDGWYNPEFFENAIKNNIPLTEDQAEEFMENSTKMLLDNIDGAWFNAFEYMEVDGKAYGIKTKFAVGFYETIIENYHVYELEPISKPSFKIK